MPGAFQAIVWDGRPSLLGGLISEDVRKKKDKIPVLGDLRCWGGFQVESSSAIKKNLVIFVTPTIIDPAGNECITRQPPLRSEQIPPQRSLTQ